MHSTRSNSKKVVASPYLFESVSCIIMEDFRRCSVTKSGNNFDLVRNSVPHETSECR